MPRPRTRDPAGLTDHPVCIEDPQRSAEIEADVRQKMAFLARNYRMAQKLGLDDASFNRSVCDLKEAVRRGITPGQSRIRLHPFLELEVSRKARIRASERSGSPAGEVTAEDIALAKHELAKRLKPIRHRPSQEILRLHFEAAVAVAQEATGKPVRASRYRNNLYDPHMHPGAPQGIFLFFRALEPLLQESRLVTMLELARRKYKAVWPTFMDFFPLYGATPGADGAPVPREGWQLESYETTIPTFFH